MSNSNTVAELSQGEKDSVLYHNIFDYPLNFSDLIKWKSGKQFNDKNSSVIKRRGYYFLKGREGLIYKRLLRKRISDKKMNFAKKASRLLSFIPQIKMVGLTGSLSMENSTEDSDIDFLIITKKGRLWTSRILGYFLLWLNSYDIRKPLDTNQKDKLCLNMWLDESDAIWSKKDRNLYTAHEIAQIVPLVNKEKTYEKFLSLNKWVLDYWPNSVHINEKIKVKSEEVLRLKFLEKLAFKMQYQHMKPKITREVVTKTRAIFHPQDLSKKVLERLQTRN